MSTHENIHEIFRVRAHNLDAIPAASVAIERLAVAQGLAPLEASRFRCMVEELCADRIATGFAPDEPVRLDINLDLRLGELVVTIQDTGSPVEPTTTTARGWLVQLLGRGFADEFHASFEGRGGNRCEIVKFLHRPAAAATQGLTEAGRVSAPAIEAISAAPAPTVAPAASLPIEYRPIAPEDALEVARCFYRTYGMSGPAADEIMYHPERCAARVREGLHLGTVAALANGRIVGHIAITRESLENPVGMGGFLVVDPEFRAHGIAERLSELNIERGRAAGLHGLLGMAVTVHTASQKTLLKHGGREVGVLLAAQEARIVMRGIPQAEHHARHAVVVVYTPWSEWRSESFPPAPHREIVSLIYTVCGLDRVIAEPPEHANLDGLPARTAIQVSVLRGSHFARIRVRSFGRDFLSEVHRLVEDLHRHNVAVLRLELPLSDPLTALFGCAAEELGFSFAAIFPGVAGGDLLCLQSLDRVEVDPAAIKVASEHGARVLAAVLESRERVLSSTTARTLEGGEHALRAATAAGLNRR